VKPSLPWHGYERQHYVVDPLKGGKARSYRFDLMPTAWVFKAGHRIRLSLAGADVPSFALHPALSADPARTPVWTIYRGVGLSRLTLPVIP
jgi:predicted acyl esterase